MGPASVISMDCIHLPWDWALKNQFKKSEGHAIVHPAKRPATLKKKKMMSELVFSVLHIPQEYMLHYLYYLYYGMKDVTPTWLS